MTISYSLAPDPKWYIADLVGRPLGGGYLATFSSLDHTLLNPVFQDAGGLFPWPYVTIPNVGSLGILFDENGAQGPFYFKFDTANPSQLYYLEVYDSDGILQWTIDDFSPGSGGGGSIITTALDLENLVVNSVMWRNIGATPVSPTTSLLLAPGAHSALVATASNAGPDIYFYKNNSSATDTISFPKFVLGDTPLTGDVTPVDYLHYSCTGAGTAETTKLVQYPITQSVQNLSNQNMTVTIWARGTAGTTTLTLRWRQFFGDGSGASFDVNTPIQTITLTSSWQKFTMQTTIPNVSGMVLGGCHNDGVFLQIQYPLDATCTIDFTKPCAYLGSIAPDEDYQTYDMIDAIISDPRTGDIKITLEQYAQLGWISMNDGTIGNPSSNATQRANFDTFALFNLLWNKVGTTWAPMFDSGGISVSYGANSVADFTANRQISLTKSLGRAFSSVGTASSGGSTNWVPGQHFGEENHVLTIPEIPAHTHNTIGGGSTGSFGRPFFDSPAADLTAPTSSTGGGGGHNTIQPTAFYNVYMKL